MDPTPALVLDAAATRGVLPFEALLDALSSAAFELAAGAISCPPRQVLTLADGGLLLSMPALAGDIAVHKLISVVPHNTVAGLPVIQGQLSVLDAHSGRMLLLLDGPTVTGRRTAAVSMLALRGAGRVPQRVLLVGAGVQARHHVDALAALYPDVQVALTARRADNAATLIDHARALGLDAGVVPARYEPDVVITCTSSRSPVYAEPARAGCMLIAVGAFEPAAAEIAAATVLASALFVDDPMGARHEAGDLIQAGVDWAGVQSLLQLLQHGAPAARPVLFKSVGCAAWDLAAARVACAAGPKRQQPAAQTAPG